MTVATRKVSTLSYLHTDHLSSNSVATNSSGNVIGGEVKYSLRHGARWQYR